MPIHIYPTSGFKKDVKRILKKHRSILSDIAELSTQLKKNPTMGVDLGHNVYKIRMAVSGTNKGKSSGARVITYVFLANQTVYLSEILLKSEHDTVDVNKVIQRLKDEGLL